ncbi:HDL409Cp [Eremothecium sinecaudum]|uniref:HDL409Cp n=1 Tax=Eremothecium sinecaudum TaxID=45286 RepID=A0A0X8HRX3_9SACH|nr:HDL409Cp [Eremothecium sinecaudum]AMD20335.1 HDL409Cp [Eremothecium sinecaudum]
MGRSSSISAAQRPPFLSTHHDVSPTLQFRQETEDDLELSDFELETYSGETSSTPNNLQFYSSKQSPGLTRSLGALNLSIGNTSNNTSSSRAGRALSHIYEDAEENAEAIAEENAEETADEYERYQIRSGSANSDSGENNIRCTTSRWSSFTPRIHKKLKNSRADGRSPLAPVPVLMNAEVKKQIPKSGNFSSCGEKKMKNLGKLNDSFTKAKPDPSAFQCKGLISKLQCSLFPQKLTIPDTPVKRTPHAVIMSSPTESPGLFLSGSVRNHRPPSLSAGTYSGSTSTSSSPTHSPCSNGARLAKELHVQQQKKKRSRIIKNTELSNMLQEFTDDLFGDDDGPLFGSSPLETPKKLARQKESNKQYLNIPSTSSYRSSISKPRLINAALCNAYEHLATKFTNVTLIGKGQFSTLYQATFPETQMKYAIKSMTPNRHNMKSHILQEIQILSEISEETRDAEGKEYVIQFISSWEYGNSFYVMTELCENGNLDQFLQEQIVSRAKRLEDWRIWKIIVEICLALRFIHDTCSIVHLDLKPANIMITFEGNLKIGDFGMATKLPLTDKNFENEGDREYIAPEIISEGIYDFRADIFSLGLIIVEIAANVVLPDNGNAWHKLRSGDLSDAGRFSSTDLNSDSIFSSTNMNSHLTDATNHDCYGIDMNRKNIVPAWVPRFLIDSDSLERFVMWMIEPDYRKRPSANAVLQTEECQYVEMTRKAGAIIQEDDFGPKPEFFT